VSRATARLAGNPLTHTFTALAASVREKDLQGRRRGFYVLVFSALVLALAGAGTGMVLLGDSWLQLLMAGALGLIFTQFAFLGHEASHRQILTSGPANDRIGRALATVFVGISYSWWMNKHTRHHANPNQVGKDPDIEPDTVSFLPESAATRTGVLAWITRRQGYLFFPALLLEGLNLHILGFKRIFSREKMEKRWLEISMIVLRLGAYCTVIFLCLPVGLGFAFIGVQLAVFGLYMGSTFAPNHKGMPLLPRDSKVDFLRRQVLTSRNIKGNWMMDTFMGGLNYQIEHHLFPNMARPHLHKAQAIAKEYCDTHNILYTETTLTESYGIVIQYLNRVGLAAGGDPFECPMATQYGR